MAKILYINTGIFMRSMDLFFYQRIRLTISSISEGAVKMNFSQVLPGNSMEIYLDEEYCDQDWRLRLKNSYYIIRVILRKVFHCCIEP